MIPPRYLVLANSAVMTALSGSGVVVSKVYLEDILLPTCFGSTPKTCKNMGDSGRTKYVLTVATDTDSHYNSVEDEHTHD